MKLTTTLAQIKAHGTLMHGGDDWVKTKLIERFLHQLENDHLENNYAEDQEIDLLTILKLDGFDSFFWAFGAVREDRALVSKLTVQLAVAFAEHVLPIFEKDNSHDDRPRKAIDAAKAWLNKREYGVIDAEKGAEYSCKIHSDESSWAAKAAMYAAQAARYAEKERELGKIEIQDFSIAQATTKAAERAAKTARWASEYVYKEAQAQIEIIKKLLSIDISQN